MEAIMPNYIPLLNEILDHVEGTPGWEVMGVGADPETHEPGFSYTIGLHHNYQHPEIITFGLPIPVAHVILNDVGQRVKGGESLVIGFAYTDIVSDYPVIFKPVLKDFIPEYFGMALRFYGHSEFPAIQLCWTDRQSRFPWDGDFDPNMLAAQPLLFEGH
jgi:hypothetical protein